MKLSPTSAGGLILLSSKSGPSIWFRDNLDVSFFGSIMLCSFATLTAKKLISLNGLTATYGTNVLDVNAANTTITGPLVVNGTLTGTGITSLLNPYATITAVNAKENSLTVVSPLVKTVGTGVNQLSLDYRCVQRRVSHCYRSDTLRQYRYRDHRVDHSKCCWRRGRSVR